uniref:Ankyrin repeat domain-containing protein n=1 Tax=Pseudictyota dubia TaxID=2749911 RepID=A0A7R9WCY4_9STRA|mmetsp:Transcript_4494/g.7827  ORF Transcript_4494/g.7827 Transcript_4494/m.7827 type:complete len:183 (+) Transcript_4494:70-618(+)|eukprot:CAMPEP_0197443102 /NCGR_PEP_ID=MMETSP1175-20131217/8951_1 /TAXON_ID=1003142 /ORGANISM="Triceratium dubium, Strain CCMP147" /LENGTH=182 /DNA_ID=CAMNT_0042973693 /DNA_START=38 /DNA_END=586 /DNA_ORIENTATION=+
MSSYDVREDVLAQAINSTHLPRGPDPAWYLPIKNMDNTALEEVLKSLNGDDVMECLGWSNAAQWTWHIRTALGYAIWRGNIDAVRLLVQYGVDVTQTVAQNESSDVHYDGGVRFSSLAYCVVCRAAEPIPILLKAGARKQDWDTPDLYNFRTPFWESGGEEVTAALQRKHRGKASAKKRADK